MPILPRSLRSALPAVMLALSLAAAPRVRAVDLAVSFAIGLEHAMTEPYNFTGRVFVLDTTDVGFGSGTLIRRHTVLTAAHVVFSTTSGFIGNATFSRGLYEDYTFQKSQVIKVNVLGGYQDAATTNGEASVEAFAQDMGFALIMDPPRDGTWGSYLATPTVLADTANQFFVLGYPGVSFDGRTMAYIVPTTSYTNLGASGSGLYENDGYIPEPGESGGPVYIYNSDVGRQYVVGETLGGIADTSGEFNATLVRAIDKSANTFLTSAEYTNGLIKKVKIKGPRTVTAGTTVIYKALPKFLVPDIGSTLANVTTERYTEVKLKTSTPGTSTQPAVTIKKLSYTEFQVTFDKTIRPKSTTTITAYYTKTNPVPNSTITITVN